MNEHTPVHCEHDDDVPLREYVERIFDEREKALEAQFQALDLRLKKLNDLRAEVTRDRDEYVRREAFEPRITRIEVFQNRMLGVVTILIILIPIITAVITRNWIK